MAIYSEFSHEKWWFSIVMLVYQRVDDDVFLIFSGFPTFLSFCGVPKKNIKSLTNLELQLPAGVTYNMMKETTYIYLYIYIYPRIHTHYT